MNKNSHSSPLHSRYIINDITGRSSADLTKMVQVYTGDNQDGDAKLMTLTPHYRPDGQMDIENFGMTVTDG
ncbi:hypothetical protein Hamer_G015318 [Homarus americanus]|uniref:Uncharacterized protein n=1 Tax=Homarus americanus TaxID=6706 RepID=A0A8J5TIJ6_HOMAM|nr:hypothetical protein Hamer_G015318 [Homarus americanus]